MVPATTIQVRNRAAARRNAVARQHKLNEERQRRDEQELDLAADFALLSEERDNARAALRAAEIALGGIVDSLIGELRIRYERAAQLLETSEDELKRLRQVKTDHTDQPAPGTRRSQSRSGRRGRPSAAQHAATRPEPPEPEADRDQRDHAKPVTGAG